jgi:thiamine-monophosphate kinase
MSAIMYFKNLKPMGFKLSASEEELLLRSWKRPVPRLREGLLLSENRIATACQDVSDGLRATIEQVSSLSGKCFDVYENKLPIAQTTAKLASQLNIETVQLAMSASVDFQLLFTMSPDKHELCARIFADQGLEYATIGEVNHGPKNCLIYSDGTRADLPGVPWRQQKCDLVKEVIRRRVV